MNCSKCGTELRDGAKFCSGCGNVTEDQSQQGSYQQPNDAQQGSYQQPNDAQQGGYQQQPNNAQQGGYQQQPNNAQQGGYQQQPNNAQQPNQEQKKGFGNIKFDGDDHTAEYDPQDIKENGSMCILSYLGILFLIPWLSKPNSPFTKFHCNQGVSLLISIAVGYTAVYVLFGIILSHIPFIGFIFAILGSLCYTAVGIFWLVCVIMGIMNAVNGKAKELPFIGGLFKIIK